MPQRLIVTRSMVRKIRFSTTSPMMMTVSSPQNTPGMSSVLRFSKMYQPSPALPGRHAEYQFGGDQRAPGEGPADLQAGEDRGEGRRHEDHGDEAQALEPVILPDHAQRVRQPP